MIFSARRGQELFVRVWLSVSSVFICVARPDTAEHAMNCFARLVRALLGAGAIAARKLEYGASLVVLGVSISLSDDGFLLLPDRVKALKCIEAMRLALQSGVLKPACAEKLAGRLSWASQFMFHRVGRAMLRPIFDQKFARKGVLACVYCCRRMCHPMCVVLGRVGSTLDIALRWWLFALECDICEEHPWEAPKTPVARMFVDAAGKTSRCAAILFCEFGCFFTDGKPSAAIMDRFVSRKDKQIMGLESVAIALGLCTFAPELHKRKVVVYSDNKGAEAAARKGSASSWDHCQVIHEIWSHALLNSTYVWIERVPSEDNLADLPSRGEYQLVAKELKASWRAPVIAPLFMNDVLSGVQ